jgi:PKD repeat protein
MGQNEQTPAAKLTVSNRAGSLKSAVIRQGSALSGDVDPGGLTVSNVVAGVPDGVARFSIRIVESNLDGTVLISGSVTAVKLGTQITRATWNWGDGSSEEIVFPLEHAYPGSGTYTMTATAFNNLGNQQSISLTVVIPRCSPMPASKPLSENRSASQRETSCRKMSMSWEY